jgi:hypothetical protein
MFINFLFWRNRRTKKKTQRHGKHFAARGGRQLTPYGFSPRIEPLERRLMLSVSPDLTVTAASLGAPSVEVGNGATISLNYTVQNVGTYAPPQDWTDGFYLSSKTSLDQTAVLVGSATRDDSGFPLAIGGSYTTSTTLTIPNTSLRGNNYLLVVADPSDSIHESNTNNNTMAMPIDLTGANVDLAVSSPAVSPGSLVAGNGASATISWTVTNNGSETAAAGWSDGVYLSSKTTLDGTAVKLGDFAAPSTLAAGGSYSQTESVTIPNTSLLGGENVLIVADDSGTQSQASTANATAAVGVSVALPANLPDLKVTPGSVAVPAAATLGQSIPVSWTVTNSGSGPASGTWTDVVYASPTSTYNAATATELEAFPAVSTLATGASYMQTRSVVLTGAATSDDYILVATDLPETQAESNYGNNVGASAAIALSVASLPSLAIVASSFTAPASADLGQTIPVSWSVQNTSTVATTAAWSDELYVSDSSTFDSTAQLIGTYSAAIAGTLAAGASYNQAVEVTLPDTATGSRYLLLVADGDGGQAVSNSTPIVAASPISLAAPDLVMSVKEAPDAAVLGEPFDVSWTVTNTGSVPADAAWQDGVYISGTSGFDPATAQLLTTVTAPSALAAGASYTSATTVNLPSLPAGNYDLYFLADVNDAQGKVNASTDNLAVAAIAVSGPSLAVTINSSSATAVAGNNDSVEIAWTVTNNSTSDAMASWSDEVYLSSTPSLNLSDYDATYWDLGGFSEPLAGALTAGNSYTQDRTVTIPSVPAAGTYYLIVDANSYGSQSVTSTAGETASAAISLTLPAVNLVVTQAAPSASSLLAGGSYTLSYSVQNQGTTAANSEYWDDEIYLSSKQTLDSSAVAVGYYYYGGSSSLAPGGSYSASLSFTVPDSVAAGSQYLLIVPDVGQTQGDSNPNYVYAAPVSVAVPDVKLAAAITSAPTSVAIGATLSLTWQVTNNGTAATTSSYWYDYIYLSTSPTYNNSAIYLGDAYIGSPPLPLAPGGSYTETQDVTVSSEEDLTPGNYYILVSADAYGTQPQADSSQSVASAPLTLTAATATTTPDVDLVVSAATAPATATAGQSIAVSYTVKNQGTSATTSYWYDYVYLSTTPTVNSYSTYVTDNYESAPDLAGGASYTVNNTITLPTQVAPGNDYLVFATNYYGQYDEGQSEVNYYNNTYAVPITISTPNLAVTAASFSGVAIEGDPVTVSWTVKNVGNATASGSWYDAIYLSDSPVLGAGSQIYIRDFSESSQSPLAVGGSYTASQAVTLPAGSVGPRYLLVVADTDNQLADPDRTNNVFAVPLTLTAPNLAVSNVLVTPSSVESGNDASLNIQWTATNTSTVNTNQGWEDEVFLSPTAAYNPDTAVYLTSASSRTDLAAGASYTTDLNDVVISNRAPGNYYVVVVVNYDYVNAALEGDLAYFSGQPESTPDDNIGAVAVTLTSPSVTLAVSNTSVASTSLVVGQTVNVSFQVANQGSETAETSWEDEVYISADSSFDSSAEVIDYLSSQSPLAAQASYTQSTSVTIPQDLTPGSYYLYFVANANRMQAEGSYAGDVSAPLPITINAPDLTISVTNPPTSVVQGEALSVSYTVTDSSAYDTTASEWFDYVYFSPTPTLNYSTATYLSYQYYDNSPRLAAGGSYTLTQTFTIPASATVGQQYYLLFEANAGQTQGVSNPADAVMAVPITIVATDVDLQVAAGSVSAPATASIGAPLTVSWSVENAGTDSAAGPWQDYIYLSSKSSFDSSAVLVDQVSTPTKATPLAAGASYNQSATFTLPAGTATGNYYLYVMANGNGAQAVISTSDEVSAASAVTLTTPYLQATSVMAPAAAVWGSTISVSWTVENNGGGTASGTWYDAVYVSSKPQFDSSAQLLGSFYENQDLATGGQYSDTETVYLDDDSAPIVGPAYILVVPDYSGGLNESSTANSSGASGQIALAAPALSISGATAPATSVAGGTIPISWTVTNTSAVSAPAQWYDDIYLSPDNVYDSRAELITDFAAPTIPLAAGASYTQSENVTLPLIYSGPEYLLFVVDQSNYQPQTNAANNVEIVPIDVSATDLTVSSVTAPASVDLGQPATVSWTVENTGTGPADESWSDGVYYSKRNSFDSSAVYLTSVPVGGNSPLAAGASYTQSAAVTLPSGLAPGNYYFLVYTNFDGQQLEINTGNNTAASAAVAVTGADLTVSSASAPATADFGQSFAVNWSVLNTGGGGATNTWTDGVYISTKDTFDKTATLLADVAVGNNAPLGAGDSYNQSTSVTVPLTAQSAAGTYYLYVVANDQGQQAVTNAANNTSAPQAITFSLPALPDLVPTGLSLPATGYNGQRLVVASWIDANNGTAAANGPWVDNVYLASDPQGDNAVLLGQATYSGTLAAGQQTVQLAQPINLPSTPGDYYLVVVADASGINEGPYASNDRTVDATPINVIEEPLPDLVVSSITPPSDGVLSGTTVPVTYTVTNQGNAPTNAAQWLDAVFVSQSPTLTLSGNDFADGYEILTQPLGVPVLVTNPSYLLPGQSYSQTVNVPLPVSASGTWYVYVATNRSYVHTPLDNFIDTGSLAESNTVNDMAASAAFTVAQAPLPDLNVAPVQTPPEAFSGQPLTVSWTVTNQGSGTAIGQPLRVGFAPTSPITPALPAASTWTDEVFMSPDPTLDSNAVSLGTFQHYDALDAGDSYTDSEQVTLPVGVSGNFYFIVETDIAGQVFEGGATADEVNSTPSAITVNLTPPPDLQTSILTAPATALASHAVTFTYEVNNIGAGPTVLLKSGDTWTDAFYLSPTATYNAATAISLGTQDYDGSLEAGANYQNTVTETVPNALSGSYYLIVNADSTGSVFELDLTSKIGATASPIQLAFKPADLVVAAASSPATGQAGGAVRVNWTVANQGSGDTAVTSWADNVYADTGASLDSNAILLGSYSHSGLLAAGASYTQSQLVTLPISLSGPYNLFVVTNEPILLPGETTAPPPVYESNFKNDTSVAVPITVVQTLADLQATRVTAPATVQTGGSVTIDWTVANNGAAATNVNYWYDDVWLSTKTTLNSGGTDVYLGTVEHSNPLATGGSYSASATVTVPADLAAGTYYFIVAVDRPVLPPSTYDTTTVNRVYQTSYAASETATTGTQVTLGPNLVVSAVTAPSTVNVDQPLTVGWTVTNNGRGGTGDVPIQDSVYLSYDQILSNSSVYLGTVTENGGLAAGAHYTQSATLPLPTGLEGTFYVFVVADTNQNVYEQNPASAVAYADTPLVVQNVPPADLVAGTITIPANAVPGQNITISYQVTNDGTNAANGAWTDSLYLSPTQTWSVSDPILGTVTEDQDLAAGAAYTGNLTAALPGLNPGSYYVILRTNILDTIPETTLSNNLSASLTQTSLAPLALTLGVPSAGTLGSGQSAFYQVAVTASQTLQINFASQEADTLNDLYVSFGSMPTRGQADYRFQQFAANQQITVPATEAGTYYILAYGDDVPESLENYSLTATVIPFSVTAVSPASVGNAGPSTIEIDGAKFDRDTTFQLIDVHGNVIQASATDVQDAATAYATFNLTGAATGNYQVQATAAGGTTTTLATGLTVTTGSGANLQVSLSGPAEVLPDTTGVFEVNYANTGDADSGAPLIFVESPSGTAMGLTAAAVPYNHAPIFLAINSNGPAGVLPPGYSSARQIYFTAPGGGDPNDFQYVLVGTDNTQAIDWNEVLNWIPTSYLQAPNWSAASALLQQWIGGTWGGFVQLLDNNAALVVPASGDPSDVGDILNIVVQKALAAVNTSLSGSLQAESLSISLAGVTVYAENTATQQVIATQSLNDGSFLFPTLPAASYTLSVQGELVTSGASVTVSNGQAASGVALTVAAGADISGQVFSSASHQPIAGATVTASNEAGGQGFVATSDANGNYNLAGLPTGVYDLVFNAAGYARSVLTGVDVTQGNATETVNLAPQSALTGTVTLESGGPGLGTLQVFAEPSGNTDANQVYETQSALDSFTLGGLPSGTYDVTLTMAGYISQTIAGVTLPAGATTNLGAIALAVASEIDGTVTSTDPNNPAASMVVQALQGSTVVGSAVTDTSGNYQIRNLPPGTYTLSLPGATGALFTAPIVTVALGQTATGESIQVQPGGIISGTVDQSTTNSPIAGITVYLSEPDGTTETTTSDSSGNYQFTGLSTGNYQVYLLLGGAQTSQTVSLSLSGPSATANLQLPFAASISGTITDSLGNLITDGTVTLYQAGSPVATAQTNALGFYDLLILQPGTYDLSTAASEGTFPVVTGIAVAAGSTVTQNFQAGSASLTVTANDGVQVTTGDSVGIEAVVEGSLTLLNETTVGADGTATFTDLAAGNYTIVVVSPNGDAGQASAAVPATTTITVTLDAQGTVSGTITDSLGNPLDGATVMIQSASNLQQGYTASTAADGTYSLSGVAPGTYDVTILAPGYLATTQAGVEVSTNATVNASLAQSTTTITGKLTDPSGNPVPSGSIAVSDAAGHIVGIANVNPDGTFTVTSAQGSQLVLQVQVQGYSQPASVTFNAPAGTMVNLAPIVLQPVAIDPGLGSGSGSGGSTTGPSDGQTWADQLYQQGEDILSQLTGGLAGLAAPKCPQCDTAYAIAQNAQTAYLQSISKLSSQLAEMLNQCFVVDGFVVAESTVIYAKVQGALALTKAFNFALQWLVAGQSSYVVGAGIAQGFVIGQKLSTHTQEYNEHAHLLPSDSSEEDIEDDSQKVIKDVSELGDDAAEMAKFQQEQLAPEMILLQNLKTGTYRMFTKEVLIGKLQAVSTAATAISQLVGSLTSNPFENTVAQAQVLNQMWNHLKDVDIPNWKNAQAAYNAAVQAYNNCQATATCNQNPTLPPPPPPPPGGPGAGAPALPQPPYQIPPEYPHDPNNIIGPAGFGSGNFVTTSQTLPYQIDFENEPTAGLPAQQVTITQQLDSNLNWQSFRLGSFGFGGTTYTVPANTAFYQTQIDLTATDGYYVDVTATIDERTGIATWTFTTIDPTTGQIPLDPTIGFLPPDSPAGIGEGYVSYTVMANSSAPTGAVINAQATVDFYTQPPIDTPQIFNTIDSGSGLTSSVAALPAVQTALNFNVSWSGTDNSAGSAIADYSVFVSDNGGPYTAWLSDTSLISAVYTGQNGHTYAFYSVAGDNAGNVQSTPAAAQARTTVNAQSSGLLPSVSGVNPVLGILAGGTTVTITGTGFIAGATTVDFGPNNPATNVAVNAAGTQITATCPAGTGTVDITVTTAGGTSATTAADQFTYNPWTIVGNGVFTSSGKADVLWQNTSTGEMLAWITGGGGLYLGTVPLNAGWTLAGIGDFTGDGKADLVWQNATSGVVLTWTTGGGGLYLGTVPLNAGWTLAGVGDFTGDGKADLVWQNATSGVVLTWTTGGGGQYLGTVPLDTGWTLTGVADFNDDGLADLLWQNQDTGVVITWITDGSGLYLGTV